MKLSEWDEDDSFPTDQVDFIAATLSAIGGKEQAALYTKDDHGDRRALVAADVALVDCGYTRGDPEHQPQFQVRVVSWDSVPAPSIAFAAVVSSNRIDGPTTATLTLDVKPAFTGFYHLPTHREAASAFVKALLAARRQ